MAAERNTPGSKRPPTGSGEGSQGNTGPKKVPYGPYNPRKVFQSPSVAATPKAAIPKSFTSPSMSSASKKTAGKAVFSQAVKNPKVRQFLSEANKMALQSGPSGSSAYRTALGNVITAIQLKKSDVNVVGVSGKNKKVPKDFSHRIHETRKAQKKEAMSDIGRMQKQERAKK